MELLSIFPREVNSRAIELFRKKKNIVLSGVVGSSSKAFIIADVLHSSREQKRVFWIANNRAEVETLVRELRLWGKTPIYHFLLPEQKPTEETAVGTFSKPDIRKISIKKVEFIARLLEESPKIIITTFDCVLGGYPSRKELEKLIFSAKKGQKISPVEFFEQLILLGYIVSDEEPLPKGAYVRKGESIILAPANFDYLIRVDFDFDTIEKISFIHPFTGENVSRADHAYIFPVTYKEKEESIDTYLSEKNLLIEDELDISDEVYDTWEELFSRMKKKSPSITFSSFHEDGDDHQHLHYISVLRYRTIYDLANDLHDKKKGGWKVLVFTKNKEEVKNIFQETGIAFTEKKEHVENGDSRIFLFEIDKEALLPHSFQSPEIKVLLVTDKEISFLREEKKRIGLSQKVYLDFLTGLKPNDFVVHADHGIAQFLGLEKRTVDDVTREYLKLGYAENDKLYVPIDQADKVNKYIGSEDLMPRLTRLGSVEWATITKKVQKETQEIAKELLKLYAVRKSAKGFSFSEDNDIQRQFEETFPYEETPGQVRAIIDTKKDMEKPTPMDRLICGDVGFGKTEVAMRAAFKAIQAAKQVAFISPITILTDQHYRSFVKRMEPFDVRVEMLSRFKTLAEQKDILKRLEKGEVDIVIGTHRLLQPDVKFKNLGLIIVDEEQRFGVQQKEKLKEMKVEADVLTLTATPIPRTLNICLNKLRDITTIMTPPPGRLPVITEVRKYSSELIREAILRETQRGGQVYYLHNRVQTIDSECQKLRLLVPEATFEVAHGQLGSGDLEERVVAFKDHKFDVLVSSTIIENGIDLPNANTLIVNNAEKFGLAQLYQLRGRVGRGKTQAYAFFLYHGQRLKLDAKKRLKAIVEASELGSGFQIAMKDLEIRGAGDILGAKQHGVINVVGVSHFIRMLNKAVEDLQTGKVEEEGVIPETTIELPMPAYIPDTYIVSAKDKINAYQRLAAADTLEYLSELKEDFLDEYGKMTKEVLNLIHVIELKILAKKAGIVLVKAENIHMEKFHQQVVLYMSDRVKPINIARLLQYNPQWQISGMKLRIGIDSLGLSWVDELKECLVRLG